MNKKTLILGMGNTVLCDDAAGILVAREILGVVSRANAGGGICVAETSYGGWRLIDILNGFDKVVIVDSISTGRFAAGECFRVETEDRRPTRLQSSHGLGLFEAIEFARASGQKMPGEISVYGVEVKNNTEFGETVSPDIQNNIGRIATNIIEEEKLLGSALSG